MSDMITMIRKNLDNIPDFTLPTRYTLRWYQHGDNQIWRDIQSPSYEPNQITSELFEREFGFDEKQLRHRQFYILNSNGIAIGTATAWFNDDYNGLPYGRIHWVAIVPSSHGLGLAKPLMTIACERLKSLGHERAYLTTSTSRIPAVNLYLKFGFTPEIASKEDWEAWRLVQDQIKYPLGI